MGIPDINSFIRALKLTWIRKLRSTKHKWKNLAAVELKHIEKIDFFGPEFLVLKNITNTFWENVIKAYKEFYYKVELKHCGELLAEPVCYNKNIKLGNDIIRKHNWQEKRVYCIAHFLHDDGSFLRREEFNGKYGLNENFLFYAGVLKTIGKFIKSTKIAITGNIAQAINAPMEKIVSVNKGAKIYYEMLIKNNLVPKCCEKWNSKVNYNINWKICFKKIKKINDINTKWFQMRIIHRIIATNITLKEMKVSENVLCGFCNEERESIFHLFWHCDCINSFWIQLERWINEKCQHVLNFSLSESLIIFGTTNNVCTDFVFDMIILLAKQYIYSCKYKQNLPNLEIYKK